MQEELLVPGYELLTTYALPGGFSLREYRLLKGWLALPALIEALQTSLEEDVWVAGECFHGIYFATAPSVEALIIGLQKLGSQGLNSYDRPGVSTAEAWGKALKLSDFNPYFHAEPDLDRLLVGPEVAKRSSDD